MEIESTFIFNGTKDIIKELNAIIITEKVLIRLRKWNFNNKLTMVGK